MHDDPRALQRERVSPEELVAEMRKAGLERIEQVKWGVLETDGTISFVPSENALGASAFAAPDFH